MVTPAREELDSLAPFEGQYRGLGVVSFRRLEIRQQRILDSMFAGLGQRSLGAGKNGGKDTRVMG